MAEYNKVVRKLFRTFEYFLLIFVSYRRDQAKEKKMSLIPSNHSILETNDQLLFFIKQETLNDAEIITINGQVDQHSIVDNLDTRYADTRLSFHGVALRNMRFEGLSRK